MTAPGPRTPEGYRALRLARGWTQQELADRLQKSRETISGRERDDPRYPIDREAELAILYLSEHEVG